MCGRFERHSTIRVIAKAFGIPETNAVDEPDYNIAPTQQILIINNEGRKQLLTCRWGFVPPWMKSIQPDNSMINARAETVASKPAFRDAFMKHRCLVVADGFYEWRREGKKKVPTYIRLKSGLPFGIAGLYSKCRSESGEPTCSCTIITTEANELLQDIHNRMPAIVPKEKEDVWLDPANRDWTGLQALLQPYPSALLEYYEVSTQVNSPDCKGPENISPVDK